MRKITETIAVGAAALSLAAVTLAAPVGAAERVHGPHFPGGQGGFHHPGSGFLQGAGGRHRGSRHDVHGHVWRGGFDGGGLY